MKVTIGGAVKPGTTRVNKTGGWRNFRPLYHKDKCVKCGLCSLLCPDSSIHEQEDKYVTFDFDFCKGCGICANECPKDAIEMVLEEK